MTGSALLEVDASGPTSFVATLRSTSPLRLLAPVRRGPSVWAFTSSYGGGMVAGDQSRLDLRLAPGSRAFLGSQSSTKIYRNPDQPTCQHHTLAHLAPRSLLVFAPDPVQPFADSRYRQHQQFHLTPTSGLVLVDTLSAGRTARDERWDFASFESRNEVTLDSKLRFLDILALRPTEGPLRDNFRLGNYNSLALVLLLGPQLREAATAALTTVATLPVRRHDPLLVSASPLPEGVVVRIAAREGADALRMIRDLLRPVIPLLGDDPWARKG